MKFNQLNGFAFDRKSKTIGAIASVDFIKQTIIILNDEDEKIVANLSDVEFLEQIGVIGDFGVINHDVVSTNDGKLYEIELIEDGNKVQLHLIDEQLKRLETGDSIDKSELGQLSPYVKFVGNINELEPKSLVDFNIKVVRLKLENEIEYFYACNNKELEEVDLIKVLFIGHNLLEEEDYNRLTVSYEEYDEMVKFGEVVETTPQNLMNYVTGITYSDKKENTYEDELAEEYYEESDDYEDDYEEEEDDCDCELCTYLKNSESDICEDCDELIEDCDCNEW